MPLYLLALWRCMDEATPAAIGFLVAAAAAVTLANFYGGLIAGVLTPVAMAAHWRAGTRAEPGSIRGLPATIIALASVGCAGVAFAWWFGSPALLNRAAFAFPRADLFRYSATWWSYLVPPVAHPVLGARARDIWEAAGEREGLLEQQVSLGWSMVALAVAAIVGGLRRGRILRALTRVPVLAAVAAAAFICSLSPDLTLGPLTIARPSAVLYDVVPMFRSYARFGGVVQLMAALLAGLGVDVLHSGGGRLARLACGALVVLAAGEYAVAPSAMWRDVLPTRAHRWVMQQADARRVLDCTPADAESASVPWLTGSRVTLLEGGVSDCTEANVAARLAAEGYTHLLVRQGNRTGRAFLNLPLPPGMRLAARFRDGQVFAVTIL